jgi:hypothetical protein
MKVAAGIGCNIREAVPVRVFLQYIASRLSKCKCMHPEQQCHEVVFLGLLVYSFLKGMPIQCKILLLTTTTSTTTNPKTLFASSHLTSLVDSYLPVQDESQILGCFP